MIRQFSAFLKPRSPLEAPEAVVPVHSWGQTALILAAENGNEESVKDLLEAKADVKAKDRDGEELGEMGDEVWRRRFEKEFQN